MTRSGIPEREPPVTHQGVAHPITGERQSKRSTIGSTRNHRPFPKQSLTKSIAHCWFGPVGPSGTTRRWLPRWTFLTVPTLDSLVVHDNALTVQENMHPGGCLKIPMSYPSVNRPFFMTLPSGTGVTNF